MKKKSSAAVDVTRWLDNHPDYKEQIKALRESRGLTQEQLAKKVDRTTRSIRHIENGEAFPRITTLEKIAAALNAELKISLLPMGSAPPPVKEDETIPSQLEAPEEEIELSYYNDTDDRNDFRIGETD